MLPHFCKKSSSGICRLNGKDAFAPAAQADDRMKKYGKNQNNKTKTKKLALLCRFFCIAMSMLFAVQSVGTFDAKAITLTGSCDECVIPGGMPFGVRLSAGGVLVIRLSGSSPASEAGIMIGDIIERVGQTKIGSVDDFTREIDRSGGKKIGIGILRGKKRINVELTPTRSDDGHFKSGVWVRDRTAGIGTVTFIMPDTHLFAGLGHGICDPDTGRLFPMSKAAVYLASIGSVRKGKEGSPGELRGYFEGARCGGLLSNTDGGVFGMLSEIPKSTHSPIPLADPDKVTTGEAYILCTLAGNKIGRYSVKIVRIADREGDTKNFIIEVTDKTLLDKTGGIVQGMSGSPIIKDGVLVGAVTHVFVNDPTKGYGIFATNMIKAREKAATFENNAA